MLQEGMTQVQIIRDHIMLNWKKWVGDGWAG